MERNPICMDFAFSGCKHEKEQSRMKNIKNKLVEGRTFLILWLTQSFSALGSSMTSYALVIWSYEQQGKAFVTAMLMVCSYAPYVLLSIFAGALSDKWNKKKTMLVCDAVAAATSVAVLILLQTGTLKIWHIYLINFINGMMNTVQSPASDVAITRVLPKKYYQKVGGLRYFSNSINSILTPIIATAVLGLLGMDFVIGFDLITFTLAFLSLLFLIRIPEETVVEKAKESVLTAAKSGIQYLKQNRGIFDLILFLSTINLTASMYNAAFPAMMLSRNGGSETAMGIVNTVVGVTTLLGSLLASFGKAPKSRVRVICNTLLFSMSTENFLLAFGRSVPFWAIGAFCGWIVIPLMSTNLEAILRLKVPVEMQGRVFSCRNTFQFFTIPIGYFLGGLLVDQVFEPLMANQGSGSFLTTVFGTGKGSGTAFLFFFLAIMGIASCLFFRKDHHIWDLENEK